MKTITPAPRRFKIQIQLLVYLVKEFMYEINILIVVSNLYLIEWM